MPIFYECERCTACCRWPGQVKITDLEISAMAAYLKRPETEFIAEFTRLNDDRTGLALTDQADGSCVFLEGANCRVQLVKPQQCRDFPNLWNFPGFDSICRAKPVEVSVAVWQERVGKAKRNPSNHGVSLGAEPIT